MKTISTGILISLFVLSSLLTAHPRQGGITRISTDGTTISGTGRTGDPIVAVSGGTAPAAHTHTTTATGGASLLPDSVAITSSAKIPTSTPTVSRQIGIVGGLFEWYGSGLRTAIYDLTAGGYMLVTGSGGTRAIAANVGTTAGALASGSNVESRQTTAQVASQIVTAMSTAARLSDVTTLTADIRTRTTTAVATALAASAAASRQTTVQVASQISTAMTTVLTDVTGGHGIVVTGSGKTRSAALSSAAIEWTSAAIPMGQTSATVTWPTTASNSTYGVFLCPTSAITITYNSGTKRTTSTDISIGGVSMTTQTFDVLKFQ